MDNNKVWFITGASKGLGLELAKKLLAEGFKVAATSRSEEALVKVLGNSSEKFLPLEMDLVDEKSVKSAIDKTINHFKTIDVLVNNAGYGLLGALEELTDAESRKNYEVNVFGLLNVIRNTMPILRANKSGHIFNISSVGGYYGEFPGWGIYCSTKFAVAGLTESLAAEVKSFGVHATIVYPGYFRTDFLKDSSLLLPQNPIADYKEVRQSESAHKEDINQNQPGDPVKLAEALIKASEDQNPPLHLFLGEDAYNMANQKIASVKSELEAWKEVSVSTGF
ncbi:oxidoreductase [Flavobacterium johnsoniae]|uniref:Short-chain dehydrogenase/reductase SDR n=1 Tax=Flavobacterium johnsoniae (strain ATCC 17061 / DSM 2064 / JCM 8514 / BCRC 14874 / CCUG 350202 / NBRC 14942 / NCIMB 11054 / UW101) TaxID=376686 RepID=A5FIU9_FLAJ1|nr:oxidoreductase [Flavobacterium johnsoniae]ABQ04872.1 short-chain dehydrogenase/reductase SDR [Flavobacterium johnsoniae UW101]OXG02929.1 short-chain dehydrogenase/reductase [Flavobacterium johnsoniae UW101]WQG83329.1 oxidoreductase [Flavobacterium johnsoniae UW101]SHK37216.1 NADP-dependent 3-hydroxy acid dehydrogenase YdfG [Flavobacterium johnsoniae]